MGAWYSYAGKSEQVVDGTGAYDFATLHNPYVAPGDYHSLTEVFISMGSGGTLDTLETGWTVAPGQYPHDPGNSTHFFVYKGVHGYTSPGPAPYYSCYDGCVNSGWHQVSSYAFPGAVIPSDGREVGFQIWHDESNGRWYIYLNGTAIGYYYDTSWPEYFHRNTLSEWYGEVSAANDWTCSDMGNSLRSSDPNSALIDYPTSTIGPSGSQNAYGPIYTDWSWYDFTTLSGTTHSFRYGGPGVC